MALTSAESIEKALSRVRTSDAFIRDLLIDALGWPIEDEVENIEDLTFEWSADDLKAEGIDAKIADGVVRQIRPFPGNPWGIFLLEFKHPDIFKTGYGMTGVLRKVLRGLVEKKRATTSNLAAFNRQNLLFICNHNYDHYRFAYFKAPTGSSQTAPLASFGWTPGDPVRTVCEFNLSALKWPDNPPKDQSDWVSQWAAAFDVERVSKQFYEDYRQVFSRAEAQIGKNVKLADGELRLFTQSLFNRLMFLRFIERKGWLSFPGKTGSNYLAALAAAGPIGKKSIYQSRIRPLFFEGLNAEHEGENPAYGEVPFLNGGLFQESTLDGRVLDIPDDVFRDVISAEGLFYRYNFTVEESTPLDIEVAVDPEMLGKVFEELVTGRHETGSYYTPRNVVSYMCREAIRGCLEKSVEAPPEALEALVHDHEVAGLSEAHVEAIIIALEDIRAVDPACGSGAYLLGLLQEIIAIRRALHSEKLLPDADFLYEQKLHIISHCLYGVDIDTFAIEIARLRLWLSLAVEATHPVPLPNLDFKVEVGNSVVGPNPALRAIDGGDLLGHQLENWSRGLIKDKDKYIRARGKQKAILKEGIEKLERRIASMLQADVTRGFDWRVNFAEVVLARGGFDIVLANPPYVRQELIKEIKPGLKKSYGDLFQSTADLYVYFYLRSLQCLRPGGMLAFISSNKWLRAGYGESLRMAMARECQIVTITDFGELPVFQSASTFPMILIARKAGKPISFIHAKVPSLDPPYPDVRMLVKAFGESMLPESALRSKEWRLVPGASSTRMAQMEKAGLPLRDYVDSEMYYGIKTGLNHAFVIDGPTRQRLIDEDPKSIEIIKPFAVGNDIRKWKVNKRDVWLIFTRRGIEIERFPAIKRHLTQWKDELKPKTTGKEKRGRKPGPYQWYEIQDNIAYYEEFDRPKIVYPDLAKESRFTLVHEPLFLANTCYMIPTNDFFLLAVLNSKSVWEFCSNRQTVMGDSDKGGRLRFFTQFVEMIPIPNASNEDRSVLSALAQRCIELGGKDCDALEAEINERVEALFGL